MSIFSSYFWLWSIVGLLVLVFLWTLGAMMNFGGFISPFGRAGRWLDNAPLGIKIGIVTLLFGLLAYPSIVHKLWADATAQEVRRAFETVPVLPGARPAPITEQFSGLYDPTGTDGTYIIGWFGAATPFENVSAFYERALAEKGWVAQDSPATGRRREGVRVSRAEFRDHPDPRQAHYELILAQLPAGSREVPPDVAAEPTVFALRLGVVDPRTTTQVSWFIDCLVRGAPTFPTCEATGWNPIEESLTSRPPSPR